MALPQHLNLQIVSGERSLVNEQVDEVEIPGSEGYFGVLPGHTPMLAMLGVGELWYRKGGVTHYLSIAEGFAEASGREPTVPTALGPALVDAFARGCQAWPGVALAGLAFARHLGRVLVRDAAAAAADTGAQPPAVVLAGTLVP